MRWHNIAGATAAPCSAYRGAGFVGKETRAGDGVEHDGRRRHSGDPGIRPGWSRWRADRQRMPSAGYQDEIGGTGSRQAQHLRHGAVSITTRPTPRARAIWLEVKCRDGVYALARGR